MKRKKNVLPVLWLIFFALLLAACAVESSGNAKHAAGAQAELSEKISLQEMRAEIKSKGYTFTVGDTGLSHYSIDQLCGLKSQRLESNPTAGPGQSAAPADLSKLPPAYSLLPYCSPIKMQGSCGAAWAFASVGVVEIVYKLKKNFTYDLSEQYLISCNAYGWGCNGGNMAFRMMKSGTPLEKCFPYSASDVPCKTSCPKYAGFKEYVPVPNEIAAIKKAIYEQGAVFSTVYVSTPFFYYTAGVYNRDDNGTNNHCVVLIGWDDQKQAWRLRNSWGTGWGENGYMWIKYECSGIGEGTYYIVP